MTGIKDELAQKAESTGCPLRTQNAYKHILWIQKSSAMTEERLIADIHVTSGGAPDGQQLPELIEKSTKNGIEVTEVVEDMAYVSEKIEHVWNLNPVKSFVSA